MASGPGVASCDALTGRSNEVVPPGIRFVPVQVATSADREQLLGMVPKSRSDDGSVTVAVQSPPLSHGPWLVTVAVAVNPLPPATTSPAGTPVRATPRSACAATLMS